ncbi:MAG: hypothetical protein methR_P1902 [Methyloprofundus sp.]|nr:MAG: hypothetical protein methR_P1902 [Methyloprofundus sp.]
MQISTKVFLLVSTITMVSTTQAATSFLEGARDTVTIHPSCREENTGLTAVGVALPVGPVVKATISRAGEEDAEMLATFPYPSLFMTTDRRGNVFNANPIMGASPSYNQAAMFGMDTIQGTVIAYGSREKTEDTKMAFWKVKNVNSYDIDTNTLNTLAYVPANEFVTVDLGFALPKFVPESCISMMKIQGAQFARCDQVDPSSKTVLAGSEPDLRQKRMRLHVERDLEKNPLPASCGEGVTITLEPTDEDVDAIKVIMNGMNP